ncbi:TonB-dependent receptor [Sphingobium sp. CR2-8]|uniref:TonB-dependent receptor n=1 Tax=Sphingobium sp. CR2-8 TaxID=1306534 RepID=UPI002DBD5419|nr:TonB-dependent receptor [Sphingobium sp. CR2-8]MEC3910952.1 TonB-dependent receptor [Sphingobium sp. CR2-8]
MNVAVKSGCALTALTAAMLSTTAWAQSSAGNETPAAAQDAGQADADGGNRDIIVTAQFRQQRLQDTPLAITALSADMLNNRDQTSLSNIGGYAPSVSVSEAPSYYGNSLVAFIRGVGQSDSSFALEPGVGIYIDDVYFGTTFGAVFDLTDLERVEILRGPQGTLSGKNSLGGSIKLFTRKPDETAGGFVEATFGRFNRIGLRASANIPLTDSLFARISGVSRSSDGYVKRLDYGCVNPGQGFAASPTSGGSCTIGTEGGKNVKGLRLSLRYAPADSPVEVNLTGDVTRDNSEAGASKLFFANNPNVRSFSPLNPFAGIPFDSRFLTGAKSYTNYSNYSNGGNYTTILGIPTQVAPGSFNMTPESTAKGYGLSAMVDIELSDALSLKSITAYRDASGTSASDFDGSPLAILNQALRFSHKQFTQELRLSGKVGTVLNYTVGGFYYDAKDRLRSRVEIPDSLFNFLTNDPVTNRNYSVFAHGEVTPFTGFSIIGGLRYTNDKKTYTFSRRNTDGTPISPAFFAPNFLIFGLDGVSGTYKKTHVDYRIGVNYRWNEALMTYAQVSTGFKGGGINPRPFVPDQVRNFGPETVTAYEAGFKADLGGRTARLNGAVFLNDYKDMQLTLFACPPSVSPACAAPANAGNAQVKGAEIELTLRPVDGLTIDGTAGYLDFKYKSVNPLSGVSLNMKEPFLSDWQASAGIQYEADLGSGTLTPRLDWTYQSSFFYKAVNTPLNRVEARSLFQVRLTYETADRDWSLSTGVTNLFNKFYYTGLDESVVAYGLVTGYVGRPREWYATLTRRF